MITRETWKRWLTHPVVDWTVFVLGVILILLSPVVGALPGPGGVFVLALGLAMVLRTSRWARRRYVEFKRWQPKAGRWTDWGLRRKSAQRREQIVKEQKEAINHAVQPLAEQPAAPLSSNDKPKSAAQLAEEMEVRLRGHPSN